MGFRERHPVTGARIRRNWFATGLLPAPLPPAISPGQARQMQQLLDEQKNWALLTPEQILGPPTREKILGIADRDAFGQPKNETGMMQYLERQEQLRARTNDVSSDAADPAARRGFLGSMGPQVNSGLLESRRRQGGEFRIDANNSLA